MDRIKIILDIFERIITPEHLPYFGSRGDGVTAEYLCDRVKITEDEKKEFNITEQTIPGGGKTYTWDDSIKTEKEFELPLPEYALLKKGLELMDKTERLNIKDKRITAFFDKVMAVEIKKEDD